MMIYLALCLFYQNSSQIHAHTHTYSLALIHTLHEIIHVPQWDLQPPTISPLSFNHRVPFRWHGSLIFMRWQLHHKNQIAISADARARSALILRQFALDWWTLMVGNQLQWGLVVVSTSQALPVVVLVKHRVLTGADVYRAESCL